MNDRLAPIRCLDPELQRFKDLTGPLGNQIHSDLAGEPTDGFTDSDWPQRPVGFAKGHDGCPANVWPNRLRDLTPKQETDHLREKPEKQVGGGRAQRITDVRRTKARPTRTRSRRERQKSLPNLFRVRRGGRPRSDLAKGAHLHTIFDGRTGVKEAKRRDDIIRGTDRGVLQQCTHDRAPSWIRVVTLAMTEAERTPSSSSPASGSRP